MSFKLVHKNANGMFKIVLKREVSQSEMEDFCQLASNIVPSTTDIENSSSYPGPIPYHGPAPISSERNKVYGPQLPNQQEMFRDYTPKPGMQTKRGEKPVDSIPMGSYVEPDEGVRIKVLHFDQSNRIEVFRVFREATGISIIGCRDIVWGNFPCPILTPETAQHILEEFKKLKPEAYAKIVPADEDEARHIVPVAGRFAP